MEPVSVSLVGFMGSGKSTVGALLAGHLGLDFVDLDRRIERREGLDIPSLFQRGEAIFRAAERAALEATLAGPPAVLACGGGTLTLDGALEALERWGVTVFLEVPLASIGHRLAADSGARPLWDQDIERRYRDRLSTYRRARYTVDADRPAPGVVQAILKLPEFR